MPWGSAWPASTPCRTRTSTPPPASTTPLSTPAIRRWPHFRPISRQEAYQADITYGTSAEFGFDYLRDNMVADLPQCVQRPLYYAIVDEVDNLLIDEARTPLIISAPTQEKGEVYKAVNDVVSRMKMKVLPYEPGPSKKDEEEAGFEEQYDFIAYEKEHYARPTARGEEKLARAFHLQRGGPPRRARAPEHRRGDEAQHHQLHLPAVHDRPRALSA